MKNKRSMKYFLVLVGYLYKDSLYSAANGKVQGGGARNQDQSVQ